MSIYATQLLRTSATHSASLAGIVDSAWNRINEGMATIASASFPNVAKSIIISALQQLRYGHLRVVSRSEVHTFGEEAISSELVVEIRVKCEAFWTRVLLSKDMGFAEAFMYGDIDCDDISSFLRLFIRNKKVFKIESFAASILSAPRFLTAVRFLGNITNTRANISAHYDIGNTMFTAFLSHDMNYSSAIFKDFNEDINGTQSEHAETLEDAQIRKMKNIISCANIRRGHRVLEIGSGWGAQAILAVRETGCTVDTLTLSSEQKALAEARIAAAGLSDKITVHLMDYREITNNLKWKNYFDRFISIEMMEHVGKDFFEEYWRCVDWALKEDDGVGCVQVITLPESRVKGYNEDVDFIRKWVIFPGGYLPSCNLLISTMTNGSEGRLATDSVSNIGPHYARTLREWKRRFTANFEAVIAPALRKQYDLSDCDLEIFRRKWIYYFDYCEAGFATRSLGDHIITFTREGNVALGCTWDDYHKV